MASLAAATQPIKLPLIQSRHPDADGTEQLLALRSLRLDACTPPIGAIDGLDLFSGTLVDLYLQHNAIEVVENLDDLGKTLEFLSLGGNRIADVGTGLKRLRKLRLLDLSHNRLEALDAYALPHALRVLDLRGNPCTGAEGLRVELINSLPALVELDGVRVTADARLAAMGERAYAVWRKSEYGSTRHTLYIPLLKEHEHERDRTAQLIFRDGDDLTEVAMKFCLAHDISDAALAAPQIVESMREVIDGQHDSGGGAAAADDAGREESKGGEDGVERAGASAALARGAGDEEQAAALLSRHETLVKEFISGVDKEASSALGEARAKFAAKRERIVALGTEAERRDATRDAVAEGRDALRKMREDRAARKASSKAFMAQVFEKQDRMFAERRAAAAPEAEVRGDE